MIVVFFGDVVGEPGTELLLARLPEVRAVYHADAIVVDAENAAAGVGLTPDIADRLLEGGADVLTVGDHVWRHPALYPYLSENSRIVRPYNHLPGQPGRGVTVVDTPGGRLGVVVLLGSMFFDPGRAAARSAFEVVYESLDQLHGVRNVIVEMHAEATSEKVAMGQYLNGRVSAVIGTHTHVRTADARVLSRGTGYVTDAGMCGARDSILGVKKENVIRLLTTRLPSPIEVATQDVWLEGVALELNSEGKAVRMEVVEISGDSEITGWNRPFLTEPLSF